ncbi:hypothetical protein RhiirC2_805509 [Rhizophagus irregularis]|uniref:Uncharacterized protein n=1 Tax=Rhizophagus irregularis TaxID=588596 RepID=A0A2N1KU29_9GLOM|nr:hypothetical protein RhiirC2_805509 [Rhizophagus irregularis]
MEFGNMGDEVDPEFFDELQIPNPVLETPLILPDVEMTPADQTVTPEISWKKNNQKARVTDDKQVKHQSTTANTDAKISAKNSYKEKKSSDTKSESET